jgi:hypothetical protein
MKRTIVAVGSLAWLFGCSADASTMSTGANENDNTNEASGDVSASGTDAADTSAAVDETGVGGGASDATAEAFRLSWVRRRGSGGASAGGAPATGTGGAPVVAAGGAPAAAGGAPAAAGGAPVVAAGGAPAAAGGAVATGSGGATTQAVTTTAIASWSDAPGACPAGTTRKDITTASQLADATRADGAYASDPANTCYFLRNGTYAEGSSILIYVLKGGSDASHRRVFVGESRTGVVIRGRATIEGGVSHVQFTNMTFNLTGYSHSGSFNTISMLEGSSDLRIDHINFTGDCKTGANGGHVEIEGSSDVIVEANVIEKFGRCGPSGHQDHGVYLAAGKNLIVRNNEIRENASRGVQFNTQGGEFGKLDQVTVELNSIHNNGHADYEDGIVMNATDAGTISNVAIRRNLIYSNYYSGLRQVGNAFSNISVTQNTFFHNGAASSNAGRSEANLDDTGSGAKTVYSKNIMAASGKVLNNCYDAAGRGYSIADNWVQGGMPSPTTCIGAATSGDPQFISATDLHPKSSAAQAYGAYSK